MIDKEFLKKCLKLYLVIDFEMFKGRDFYKCFEDVIFFGIIIV